MLTYRAKALSTTLLIAWGGFILTLAAPDGLLELPIQVFFKNSLHLEAPAVALFFAIVSLPWYLKPLFGFVADLFPLLGSGRKYYLILSATAASFLWLIFPLLPTRYLLLMSSLVLVNLFMVMASTILGAVLVEAGQAERNTGWLSTIRVLSLGIGAALAGLSGGYLAESSLFYPAVFSSLALLSLGWVGARLIKEEPVSRAKPSLKEIASYLRSLRHDLPLWQTALIILLFTLAPGFETPLFYYQSNALSFSN